MLYITVTGLAPPTLAVPGIISGSGARRTGRKNPKHHMEVIQHAGKVYPAFQASGFAARFVFPFAAELCRGVGYDIGCNRPEWALPGAIPIDPAIDPSLGSMSLPDGEVDYIFSSHMLEHADDWVAHLDNWIAHVRPGGVIFLYLPDYSQTYWRPWNNRKHRSVLSPDIISDFFVDRGMARVFASGVDLNSSFCVVAER